MNLYINSMGYYIPSARVTNDYFLNVNGLTSEWIEQRTGIVSRSKAEEGETVNILGEKAVRNALGSLPYDAGDVELIVSASYSPVDTVHTIGHHVQRIFSIDDAQVIYVSSACSSFVNALEIVEGYFASGKASKALVIAGDMNSYYNDETDSKSGHLWGDGAAAVFLSKEPVTGTESYFQDVYTRGLGNVGKADTSISLFPKTSGITMNNGRDVFMYACKYMINSMQSILDRNSLTFNDIAYIAGHQANLRILSNVAESLGIDKDKFIINIREVGNTGCASNFIALAQYWDKVPDNSYVMGTVFGGGYSCGSYLLKK